MEEQAPPLLEYSFNTRYLSFTFRLFTYASETAIFKVPVEIKENGNVCNSGL